MSAHLVRDPRHSRRALWASLLIAALCLQPTHAQETPKTKKKQGKQPVEKKIEGEWTIVAGANRGQKIPPQQLEGSLVVLKDHSIIVLDPDKKELYRAVYTINTKAKPYEIDMRSKQPGGAEVIGLGIFEFTKQGWRLAYGLPGEARPEAFKVSSDQPTMIFQLKKAPDPKEEPLKETENPPTE